MNRKKLLILIAGGILLLTVSLGFFSVRSRVRRTEDVLGPPTNTLSWAQRVRLALQCGDDLDRFTAPLNPSARGFVLEIGEQESVPAVIARIAEGLGCDADLIRTYWVYTGADRQIRPGRYALTGSLTIPQITDLVTAAENMLLRFSFFSGMRLEELAALIDASGFSFSGDEFLYAAQHYPPDRHPAGGTSLEGYFVPGTYEMIRNISLDNFLSNFMGVFDRRVRVPYEAAFRANGLSLDQAVILASMIAREAMSESEYGLIASVFYNRLTAGMKLESDPTAQYAIGWDASGNSWWKNPLSAADISVYSAYNTYVVNGLPPGPICSPDAAIYEAVAYPEQSDYYFFRARCDNTPYHNFSKTYEEHVSYACR